MLMTLSGLLFVAGTRWYRRKGRPPPGTHLFTEVWHTARQAWANHQRAKQKLGDNEEGRHWLNYYFDTHRCELDSQCISLKWREAEGVKKGECSKVRFVSDLQSTLRVMLMFAPLSIYWALFYQQYPIWLFQALFMDYRLPMLGKDTLLLPDQVLLLHPALSLLFIPLAQVVLYPTVERLGVGVTPLRKMVVGGLLAAAALLTCAGLQKQVDATLPGLPEAPNAYVTVWNSLGQCDMRLASVSAKGGDVSSSILIPHNCSLSTPFKLPAGKVTLRADSESCMEGAKRGLPVEFSYALGAGQWYYLYIGENGALLTEVNGQKPMSGVGESSLGIVIALSDIRADTGEVALCREGATKSCDPSQEGDYYRFRPINSMNYTSNGVGFLATTYESKQVRRGHWRLYIIDTSDKPVATGVEFVTDGIAGVYTLTVTGNRGSEEGRLVEIVPANSVPILWQLPQIAMMTASETLFFITAMEFAYSQAGKRMKALVQGYMFLTASAGHVIVIIAVLKVDPRNLAFQSALFGGIILVDMVVFALMSMFYYEYRKVPAGKDKGK